MGSPPRSALSILVNYVVVIPCNTKPHSIVWFCKKINGMEWSVMEPIPSNTTHLTNFPFHPIWEVCDGMEYNNNKITTLSLFFIPKFL